MLYCSTRSGGGDTHEVLYMVYVAGSHVHYVVFLGKEQWRQPHETLHITHVAGSRVHDAVFLLPRLAEAAATMCCKKYTLRDHLRATLYFYEERQMRHSLSAANMFVA